MTNPDNVGGLPELPPNVGHLHSTDDYCPERAIKTSEWPVNLYTADQMRAYGELCRAASGDVLNRIADELELLVQSPFHPTRKQCREWVAELRALSRGVPEGST